MAASAGPGPFTRSRTNLFLSYRDSAVRSSSSSYYTSASTSNLNNGRTAYDPDAEDADESKGLMAENDLERGVGGSSSGGGAGANGRALPPKWVDIADRVDEIVEKVKPKIAHLDKLHAKHILPGFKDRTAEEREIESLATEITRDFRTTQKFIRQIAEMSKSLLSSGRASEAKRVDLIMAANVQTALATKVQELSGVFRKKQTAYLRQLKGHERSSDSKDPLASLADDEQYSQSFLRDSNQLPQQQQFESSPAALDMQRREAEISSIAQSITDLADLFKDLSSLVIDQGTLLDRVDWNVEQMGVEVRGAVEELKVATTYQRRSGKYQCIFLLVLLIASAFIAEQTTVLVIEHMLVTEPRAQSTSSSGRLLERQESCSIPSGQVLINFYVKVACVTGGTRGLGLAIALRLAKDGYDVAITDVAANQAGIEAAVAQIRALGRRSFGIAADVTDDKQVESMIASIVAAFGSLDCCVANAGVARTGALVDQTAADRKLIMDVNVHGVMNTAISAARHMIKQGTGGRIILAASTAAFSATPMLGVYCSSKYAVHGFVQAGAKEWGRFGIRVNAYAPGIIPTTHLWKGIDASLGAAAGVKPGEVTVGLEKGVCLGRLGSPEDVAKLVSFLASNESEFITETMITDGGTAFA
ncbi:hypothetical protein RQP46_007473 [Phenoliferia psychrophenolica]